MKTIVNIILYRPGSVLLCFGVLLVTAVLLTGILDFERDIFKIFPRDNRSFRVLVHALKTSTPHDKLYVLVKGPGSREELISAGKAVSGQMKEIRLEGHAAFRHVTFLKAEALSSEDFEELLKNSLSSPRGFLTQEDIPRLEKFLASEEAMERQLRRSMALLAVPGSSRLSDLVSIDPLNLRRFLIEKLQRMNRGLRFAEGPYLLSPDKRALLIIAEPSKRAMGPQPAASVLNRISSIQKGLDGVSLGATGGYAIAAQEEAMLKGDILGCLAGSALGIAILFFIVYRNLLVLSFIFLPLGVGLQLAMGTMALVLDGVHLLAMAFSTVVLGLGIDFAIHMYDRYKMERQGGLPLEKAVELSVQRTGSAVAAGGLTTLSAFFVLTLTDNAVLSQIGWLVALGLFFCLITILWALPAGLVWLERHSKDRSRPRMRLLGMQWWGKQVNHRPRIALVISLVFFGLTVPGIFQLRMEKNPSALKPKDLGAIEVQEDLIKRFGEGEGYLLAAWSADDLEGLWSRGKRLDQAMMKMKRDDLIGSWASPTRIASLGSLKLEGLDRGKISDVFGRFGLELGEFRYTADFLDALTGQETKDMTKDLQRHGNTRALSANSCNRLSLFPPMLRRFLVCEENNSWQGIGWAVLKKGQTPLVLRDRLSEEFEDVILINPDLAVEELVSEVRGELGLTLGVAGGLVVIILGVFFRRISAMLIAPMPMLLGLAATAGIMGWTHLNLNLLNFIVLPILVGIGLDDGIHVYRRYQESRDIEKTLATTGRSIFLTTMTTICGFGSLSLADYHVLQGMGLTVIFGITACFVFSVVTLPAVLRLRGDPPEEDAG